MFKFTCRMKPIKIIILISLLIFGVSGLSAAEPPCTFSTPLELKSCWDGKKVVGKELLSYIPLKERVQGKYDPLQERVKKMMSKKKSGKSTEDSVLTEDELLLYLDLRDGMGKLIWHNNDIIPESIRERYQNHPKWQKEWKKILASANKYKYPGDTEHIKGFWKELKDHPGINDEQIENLRKKAQIKMKSKKITKTKSSGYLEPVQEQPLDGKKCSLCYWEAGDSLSLEEVMAIMIYTNFDVIQKNLTRQFRLTGIRAKAPKYLALNPKTNKIDSALQEKIKQINAEYDKSNIEKIIKYVENWEKIRHFKFTFRRAVEKLGEVNASEVYTGVTRPFGLAPARRMGTMMSTTTSKEAAIHFTNKDKGQVITWKQRYPALEQLIASVSALSDYAQESEHLFESQFLDVALIHQGSDNTKFSLSIDQGQNLYAALLALNCIETQIWSINSLGDHSFALAGFFDRMVQQGGRPGLRKTGMNLLQNRDYPWLKEDRDWSNPQAKEKNQELNQTLYVRDVLQKVFNRIANNMKGIYGEKDQTVRFRNNEIERNDDNASIMKFTLFSIPEKLNSLKDKSDKRIYSQNALIRKNTRYNIISAYELFPHTPHLSFIDSPKIPGYACEQMVETAAQSAAQSDSLEAVSWYFFDPDYKAAFLAAKKNMLNIYGLLDQYYSMNVLIGDNEKQLLTDFSNDPEYQKFRQELKQLILVTAPEKQSTQITLLTKKWSNSLNKAIAGVIKKYEAKNENNRKYIRSTQERWKEKNALGSMLVVILMLKDRLKASMPPYLSPEMIKKIEENIHKHPVDEIIPPKEAIRFLSKKVMDKEFKKRVDYFMDSSSLEFKKCQKKLSALDWSIQNRHMLASDVLKEDEMGLNADRPIGYSVVFVKKTLANTFHDLQFYHKVSYRAPTKPSFEKSKKSLFSRKSLDEFQKKRNEDFCGQDDASATEPAAIHQIIRSNDASRKRFRERCKAE